MPGGYLVPNLVHAICTYHRQWIPGDPRGWRSRGHKVHSSGDYRNPPPAGEHAGLRRHVETIMTAGPAFLDMREFPIVGRAFMLKLHKLECEVQALSCGTTHLHVMYQSRAVDAFEELGKAKQFSSLKLRHPSGKLWGEGGKIVRINDAPHAARCFEYICAHATKEGAFVWLYDRDARPTRDSLEEVIAAARGNT